MTNTNGLHTEVAALVVGKLKEKKHPLTSTELFDELVNNLPNARQRSRKARYNSFRMMLTERIVPHGSVVRIEGMGYWPADVPFDLAEIKGWTQTRTTSIRIKAEVTLAFIEARRNLIGNKLTESQLLQHLADRGVVFPVHQPMELFKRTLDEMVMEGGLVEIMPQTYCMLFAIPQTVPAVPARRQVAHA